MSPTGPGAVSLDAELEGLRVSSVVFVEDYFQLILDHVGVTAHAAPHFVDGESFVELHDPRFPHRARELIGSQVTGAGHDASGATVRFSNGQVLFIPFSPEVVEPMLLRARGTVFVFPDQ